LVLGGAGLSDAAAVGFDVAGVEQPDAIAAAIERRIGIIVFILFF
jgi:hypothetical protein